jgi:predicted PolB exonuclease-like 3'-5' exonuclease
MPRYAIIWDLETVPDFDAIRSVNDFEGTDEEANAKFLNGKFPKHVFHKIVCIGAIVAERDGETGWKILRRGAPHSGERSEAELIGSFTTRIDELTPLLVTFNGHSFDLPVLRYRAMIHKISAAGLTKAPYFKRYGNAALDLMDELASYGGAKATLHEICRSMGLPGKASGVEGSQVSSLYAEGRLADISSYCVEDVTNTYRLWLRYELFCGRLSEAQFVLSDEQAALTPSS